MSQQRLSKAPTKAQQRLSKDSAEAQQRLSIGSAKAQQNSYITFRFDKREKMLCFRNLSREYCVPLAFAFWANVINEFIAPSKFASEPLHCHLSSVFYRLLCPPYISIDVLLTFRLLFPYFPPFLYGKFCSGRKSVVDVILPRIPRECQLSY